MADEIRAQRATVVLGDIEIEGFMLPDGSYRMSQTQAAEIVEKPEINARRFLDSKAIKALLGGGYTPDSIEVEAAQLRGQTRINALPLNVVTAYWFTQARQGNEKAASLVWAMLTETLERRFDRAFGVSRSEDDWNQQLSERIIVQLENDVASALAESDLSRYRERLLEQQLRDNGIEPWALPGDQGQEEE
ncbi:hypothetical protein [Leptolyngbya ohadii]|uniref:hypothetical protein n=1 Tax=Leptolyngbya ohadii TaxID=1962290 RepID=UPI0019D4760A|nr:hypothetical protein [Leptolyngbya ohadii]